MNCREILTAIESGADDASVRGHVRVCADCLEKAVAVDPDFLFRSLGGDGEAEPPGGVDAFVEHVIGQVRIRENDRSIHGRPRRMSNMARWALAATVVMGVLIAGIVGLRGPTPVAPHIASTPTPVATLAALDRPIIESYDSADAMIVEISAEETSDIRLVLLFDESLPADL